MDLYLTIMALNRAIMLVPQRRVDLVFDDGKIIKTNLQNYIFRSFLEQLIDRVGVDKEQLFEVLKEMPMDEDEYPSDEHYGVIFH
jgi:hypothetical protein